MGMTLITAPAVEPVSLIEVKNHLRLDSGTFADEIDTQQSIVPAQHAIGTTNGTGIDVLNYDALVILDVGTVAATTTLDVKVQESDDNITFADLASGGSFTQVTTANDNAAYELAYSGTKQYIRAVGVVANDVADCSATIVRGSPETHEDDLITDWIIAARKESEKILRRALITQTWDYTLDAWPAGNVMKLPLPPLQSVTHVKYKDTAAAESTWSSADYIVDTASLPGRIGLAYGETWPSTTLQPIAAITVRLICGYGDAATDVEEDIRQAIKLIAATMYENREVTDVKQPFEIPYGAKQLLEMERVYSL